MQQHPQSTPQVFQATSHLYFEFIKNKWNTNQEIADTLYAAQSDPNSTCISTNVTLRPSSGTQVIYPRHDGSWFKNDDFLWRKRKEGKLVREDHIKLKIHKQQVISANYVHSAVVPTFHRRVYWLTDNPSYVLVHYLNESNLDKGIQKTAEIIAECIKSNNTELTSNQLGEQLASIYAHCLKPEQVPKLVNAVFEVLHLKKAQETSEEDKTTAPRQFQLERRNSCSSAFRRGLSSLALRRQPSTNSEIDAGHIGTMMRKFGGSGNTSINSPISKSPNTQCTCAPSTSSQNREHSIAMDSRSASGETEIRSTTNFDDEPQPQPSVLSALSNSKHLPKIVEICPNRGTVGEKVLVVGGWYLKGHIYKISFGNGQFVPAKLVQAGVLMVLVPPGNGVVQMQVFCNGQAVSSTIDFTYNSSNKNSNCLDDEDEDHNRKVEEIGHQIFEKLRVLAYSFDVYNVIENLASFGFNESWLLEIVHQIELNASIKNTSLQFSHGSLFSSTSQMGTKTILHLAATLDFDRLFDAILNFSSKLGYFYREFDPMARDFEGCTPLHLAARNKATRVAKYILNINQMSVDVLDDRGRTPAEIANDRQMLMILNGEKCIDDDDDENHVNPTELWVMTNGETVTREHLLLCKMSKAAIAETDERNQENSSCSMISESALFHGTSLKECDIEHCVGSCCNGDARHQQLHVEISMDTDVHVPDSPKMARLFHVVTSPGVVVTDNARAKMADLARQIIDALPERIKNSSETFLDEEEENAFLNHHNPLLSQSIVHDSMDSSSNAIDDFYDMMGHSISEPRSTETVGTGRSAQFFASDDRRSFASSSTRANTFESDTLDFEKDLGEFFNINVDGTIDPIQQRLANLKYNDDEQRDVYEAAMVIQRAYREYRARNTTRRQEDIERRAALKIQGCYRRYKQFCYFKKLHNAAIVVQKHFRMRKNNEKEEESHAAQTVPEHPTIEGQSIRIQVPQTNSSLLREHRAATTIQLAYRGHRKRQAAARKIQNFMRQSRNKLRKMHAQNEEGALFQNVPEAREPVNQHQQQNQPQQQNMQPPRSQTETSRALLNQETSSLSHQTVNNAQTQQQQPQQQQQQSQQYGIGHRLAKIADTN